MLTLTLMPTMDIMDMLFHMDMLMPMDMLLIHTGTQDTADTTGDRNYTDKR